MIWVRSAWSRWLAASATVALAHLALPIGFPRGIVYQLVGFVSVAVMLVGIRRNTPSRRVPWYLLTAGIALMTVGDLLWSWFELVLGTDPYPSAADVVYLAAYPFLGAGLLMLARARGSERHPTAAIDSLLVSVGLGLVAWVTLVAPALRDPELDLASTVVGAAYPIVDIILIGLLVRLLTAPGARSTASVLLVSATGSLMAVDALFQLSAIVPTIEEHVLLLDAGWLGSYALFGAAALAPGMRLMSERAAEPEQRKGRQRLLLVGPAVFMAPTVLVVQLVLGGTVDVWAAAVAAVALTVLSLIRMARMTRWLEEQAQSLRGAADTDIVTGLANRRLLVREIRDALAVPRARVALVLVDVDRFSEINETFGHRIGDEVLIRIGERLRALAGDAGLVARPGGDEFAILFRDVPGSGTAMNLAQSVHDALARPVRLDDLEVRVQVSVGLVVAPDDGTDPLDLLHRGDVALSTAKRGSRLPARYDVSMSSGSTLAPALGGTLLGAISRGELVLHYQPIVEVSTGRVVAVEALVRWQHPEHGLLTPNLFIPTAERTGVIGPLTRDVLDQALRAVAGWRADGLDISVAVNLAAQNLLDPEIVSDVRAALARHGLPAGALELEITESSAMSDPERALEALDALERLGVELAVDDYGTGHSSLAYLHRLPVGRLKLDRAFVGGIAQDRASEAIVRSTIELARHLGLSVVAEGVEDDATFAMLAEMGCYAAQGFGLARPGPEAGIPAVIAEITRTRAPAAPARREGVPAPRTAAEPAPL